MSKLEKLLNNADGWNPDRWSFTFLAYLLCSIAEIAFILPAQMWNDDYFMDLVMSVVFLIGSEMYVRRYEFYKEFDKNCSIYKVLQYMPVEKKQIWKFEAKKLLDFCSKFLLVAIIAQIIFALTFYRQISIMNNIFMPFVILIVIPYVLVLFPRRIR